MYILRIWLKTELGTYRGAQQLYTDRSATIFVLSALPLIKMALTSRD
jgi:hypothetical protein